MKAAKLISFILLGLVALGALAFSVYSQSNLKTKTLALTTAEAQNTTAASELNLLQLTRAADQLSATSDYTRYSTSVAKAVTQSADLSAQLTEKQNELSDLQKSALCSSVPQSINYASNATVSESIKAWLEDKVGKIDKVDWDAIWTNSKTTIHKLTGEFLFVYIVYFNDDFGNKNSVYNITSSCWLDRQTS